MDAMMLDVRSIGGLTDDELFALCASNKMLRIERTAQGEIMLLHPTGGGSGYRNADITYFLARWNRQQRRGIVFDSSAGFLLPSGAMRSPDGAFVLQTRWDGLSKKEQEKFVPLCPDFVVELLSESDSLTKTHEKMHE